MELIIKLAITYFLIGILVLGILEIITHRITKRITSASAETQQKLIASGTIVGQKTATIIIVLAIWLFWPLYVYAAIRG